MRPITFPGMVACALLVATGCRHDLAAVVDVTEVDGSSDHRIFRIGTLSRLMMEPAMWRLEDSHIVDFDLSLAECLKDRNLPPGFARITLRELHENRAALPQRFFDFQTEDIGHALLVMAICERLRMTPDRLIGKYLIEPYGLHDTCFAPRASQRNRIMPASADEWPWLKPQGTMSEPTDGNEIKDLVGGMMSSPCDMLRIAYVTLPHLNRVNRMLHRHELFNGRKVYTCLGKAWGGRAIIGFDPIDRRAVVRLTNASCPHDLEDELVRLMQSLADVRLHSAVLEGQ